MYESPITCYVEEVSRRMEEERENAIMVKISETIGMDVDKEELIKALKYDRHQYQKGYSDGKNDILKKIRVKIEEYRDTLQWSSESLIKYEAINYILEQILDKYMKGE